MSIIYDQVFCFYLWFIKKCFAELKQFFTKSLDDFKFWLETMGSGYKEGIHYDALGYLQVEIW